jgi:cleavage and polyadenylation specificity factor subunit 2
MLQIEHLKYHFNFKSRSNTEDFDLFSLDDIGIFIRVKKIKKYLQFTIALFLSNSQDAAFDKIQQLKYSQTISLKGKGQGLQITALPGGHMIGGTIWKILKEGEEEIIYAVDYNHHKERFFSETI